MRVGALVRKDLPLFQAAVDDVVPAVFDVEPSGLAIAKKNNLESEAITS